MKIAVLLTVHNRKDTTLACLKRLFLNQCEGSEMNVYLVDDGSTDGTSEAVEKQYPNVRIIKGNGNLFWCRGMVEAWKNAAKDAPDFYLWLNDDTMLYDSAVGVVMSSYSKVDSNSIIAGAIVSSDGETVSYGGKVDNILVEPNGTLQELDKINGNFVLVPKQVYQQIGMLDSHFHHAYGDWEYGIRLKKNGGKLYLTPSFVGVCNRHDKLPKCYDCEFGLIQRFKHLYSPVGPCPSSAFYYDFKCRGLVKAVLNYSYMNIRCALPYFWSKTKY